MPVNSQHPDYQKMAHKWKRCRDVYDGQDAVHNAGEEYLPRLVDQPQNEYTAYVKRATFYNATYRTISGLVGMMFRSPPKLEVPEAITELLEDVTMSGVTLQQLIQEVASDALNPGRIGILVDCPEIRQRADNQPLTMADAMQQNIRPTMQLYKAENIINWKTRRLNNQVVLTLVVLREIEEIEEDEFKDRVVDRFRVLDLDGSGIYRVRIFERRGDADVQIGGDIYPLMNGKPMNYIPFIFVGADSLAADVVEPPYIDLVNLNLSHYRSTADYEHGAHFTGLPTPVVTGYTPENATDKLYIGSMSAWVFPDKEASATYLEFSGDGLGTIEKMLNRKETQMAILGARMLEPQRHAVESAEGQSIHRKGEESLLSQVAQTVSQGVERALGWFTEWAGVMEEVVFEINRDFFPVRMDPQELTALVGAWQQGAISEQELFDNLQKGEIIREDVTLDEHQAQIEQQQIRLADQQAAQNKALGLNPDGTPKQSANDKDDKDDE